MNQLTSIRAAADVLPRATTFRAWRVTESGASIELDTGDANTIDDAVANALTCGIVVLHKETVLIHERDDGLGRGVLHSFAIKRRSRPEYVRDPITGKTVQAPAEYPEPTFKLAVDAFEPTMPFDALRDCAVGVDRSLVSQ